MRFFLIVFLPCICFSQANLRRTAIAAGFAGAGGAMWGLHEVLMHHPGDFLRRFPNVNQRFWIPSQSWNRPTVMGYKFDAKHLLASGAQISAVGCGLVIGIGERRKWWRYGIDIGVSFAAYSLGNWLVWDVAFR